MKRTFKILKTILQVKRNDTLISHHNNIMSHLVNALSYYAGTYQDDTEDHIYVDFSILNSGVESNEPVPIVFSESRSSPIIKNPQLYSLTIPRMQVFTGLIPSFIPDIQVGQSNVNLTTYSFTLAKCVYNEETKEYDIDAQSQAYVTYVASDLSQPIPQTPTTTPDYSSSYYYVNNFGQWVDMCNTALQTAFTALSGATSLPSSNAPYLLYDPTSNDVSLLGDKTGYDTTATTHIGIYMNNACHLLFSSLNTIYYGGSADNGMNYKVQMKTEKGDSNVLTLDSVDYITAYQEFPCTSTWNACKSIVVMANGLGIGQSISTTPKVYNGLTKNINANPNVSYPIITDIEVLLTTGTELKPNVLYSPNFYRWFDLYGTSDVSEIIISVFWKSKYGELKPVMLPVGSYSDIKILFCKNNLIEN